jgi:hypothetical protein
VLATNHVLAGAAIGHLSGNPLIAVAAGLLSHLAMDAVPHWGGNATRPLSERTYLRVARSDGLTLLAVLAVLILLSQPADRLLVALGALSALAPDLDKPWAYFVGDRLGDRPLYGHAFARFNGWLQTESPTLWWVELLGLVALVTINLSLAGLIG